jgi:hypothetical protein
VSVVSEGAFLFVVLGGKVSASLVYIYLSAVGESEFVNTGSREFVLVMSFVGEGDV